MCKGFPGKWLWKHSQPGGRMPACAPDSWALTGVWFCPGAQIQRGKVRLECRCPAQGHGETLGVNSD